MSAQPSVAAGSAKPQPVAVEIPVTVNGASTVAGSEKREPFSESTQTVLVFGSGAVIRLTATVGPGQLLFVTNEKSKKEVVCQVVKSKQSGGTGGYVELKFTEAAADFWGIRFPGGALAPAPAAAPPAIPPGPAAKSPEPKREDLKITTPLAAEPNPQPAAKPVIVFPSTPAQPAATAKSTTHEGELRAPAVDRAPSAEAPPKLPTLSDFLSHGSNGLELKAPERPHVEQSPRPASAAPDPLSAPAEKDPKPGLGAALGMTPHPAPGTATFDLAAEEVKIPSWLEPLARNSASPVEGKAEGTGSEARVGEDPAGSPEAGALESHDQKGVLTLSGEGRAPNFGTSLPLGAAEQAKGSGKGWKIALLILALALVTAAAWYWYVRQPSKVSASEISNAARGLESMPAPAVSNPAPEPAEANIVNRTPSRTIEQPAATLQNPAGEAGQTRAALNGTRANHAEPPVAIAEEQQENKPVLGAVRLAAPVVTRSAAPQDSSSDPGLALGGVSSQDSSGLSMLANKDTQPVAPLPVGGDVIPARLLSSVPPVYPPLARAQRLSGDVTIDALIDANGHVSATRVISGPALLHRAAMEAVQHWKYRPATLNGQATAMHLTVTVQFRLE
jgi:TonB family protein